MPRRPIRSARLTDSLVRLDRFDPPLHLGIWGERTPGLRGSRDRRILDLQLSSFGLAGTRSSLPRHPDQSSLAQKSDRLRGVDSFRFEACKVNAGGRNVATIVASVPDHAALPHGLSIPKRAD